MKANLQVLAGSVAIALSSLNIALWGAGDAVVELESIVVHGSPFASKKEDLVVPASQLAREDLERALQSSLGATLDGEPGVRSSYFGPGSGRPIIRGFNGDRVRILNQGTDSFDVSETSPDHGVSIEPLFAREIEVLRGPATLLYGNAAIGGVVNVIGKELPLVRSPAPVSGQFDSSHGSAADEGSAGLALQGGESWGPATGERSFAWSLGYLDRSAGDIEIPGTAESAYLVESEEDEHLGSDHDDHDDEDDQGSGVLDNSFVDTRAGYVGMTWFEKKGSIGASFSRYESEYGVPGHFHEHEEEHEHGGEEETHLAEEVTIDLEQSRVSLRGELLEPVSFLESIETLFTYGDYLHRELEGERVGTTFGREGSELRATGVHAPLGAFTGAVGLHFRDESFSAVGEEAFIPSNAMSSGALFLVERLDTSWGAWELGGRLESISIDPDDARLRDRSFTTGTASVGFLRRLPHESTVTANLTYAERAPNATELFAFGPHVGTQSFEIGNENLGLERSVNVDFGLRRSAGRFTGALTAFFSDFSDFVYLQYLDQDVFEEQYGGVDTEGLRAFRSRAVDARFYGFELELRYQILDQIDEKLHFDFLADQTRATNESFDTNLPRIPTRRFGGRIEYERGPWLTGTEGRYHEAASRLGPNELPTDSYFLWGMDLRYRLHSSDTSYWDIYVVGRNLGDAEARPHQSFLKDRAPVPGRDWRLGLRAAF